MRYKVNYLHPVFNYLIVCALFILSDCIFSQTDKELFLLGSSKLSVGKTDSAIIYLQRAVELNPSEVQYHLKLGIANYKVSNYEDALSYFEDVNEINKGTADLWISKCFAHLKNYDQAIAYLQSHLLSTCREKEKTIKSDNAFDELQNTDGWFELWQKEWYSPEEKLEDEINLLAKNDDYLGAIDLINEIVNDTLESPLLYSYRARLHFNNKNYRAAIQDYSAAIKDKKNDMSFYLERGKARMLLKNYSESLEDFNKVLRNEPDLFEVYLLRASAYENLKDFKKAIEDAELYNKLFPDNRDVINYCGELHFKNSSYMQALKYFNMNLKVYKGISDYYKARGKVYLNTNSYKFAIDDLSMALDLNPNDTEAYIYKGLALHSMGEKEKACDDWNQSVKLGNRNAIEFIIKYCQ